MFNTQRVKARPMMSQTLAKYMVTIKDTVSFQLPRSLLIIIIIGMPAAVGQHLL